MNPARDLLMKIHTDKRTSWVASMQRRCNRIVVIGDAMVDRWVHGRTEECQEGCTKFVQESVVETFGGAANAERSIGKWGVDTALFSFAQNDRPVKTRYVPSATLCNAKVIFRSDDDGSKDRGKDYDWAREMALEMIPFSAGVLLSDYDKGFLTAGFIQQVVAQCSQRGIPCVADCKRPPEFYRGCILKFNEVYHTEYAEDVFRGCKDFIVTAGERNPKICSKGWHGLGHDLPLVECVNHVGAGDCFAAHMVLALAYGCTLVQAAALAHSAGRVYVQRPHNQPPAPDAIAVDMAQAPAPTVSV